MLSSLLIGLSAGSRSLTPLVAVMDASRRGALPESGAPGWLGSPLVELGAAALAAGELLGDKLPSAPDRIVPVGLAARVLAAGLAGAALAPRRRAGLGAALAAAAAVAAAFATFGVRRRAMRRFGQTRTGLVEDGLTLALSRLAVRTAQGRRRATA